jgi:NAD(P)-dependent dehydrogenase (short-subunit alcohol dehydrogenase family)
MTTKSATRSYAKDINRAAAPFAVVTGASTRIGLELARQCAAYCYDLLVVADEPEIQGAAEQLRQSGQQVEALEADLAATEGVDRLLAAASGRRSMLCWPMSGAASAAPSSTRILRRCGGSSTPTSPARSTSFKRSRAT